MRLQHSLLGMIKWDAASQSVAGEGTIDNHQTSAEGGVRATAWEWMLMSYRCDKGWMWTRVRESAGHVRKATPSENGAYEASM